MWDPPAGEATGYQTEFTDRPDSWDYSGSFYFLTVKYGEQNTGADTTTSDSGNYWVHVVPFRNGGGTEASASAHCTAAPPYDGSGDSFGL